MLSTLYHRLPGPKAARITMLAAMAVVLLTLVIWSYEILGDLLDSGGTVGE
jgi:hypothetical protein